MQIFEIYQTQAISSKIPQLHNTKGTDNVNGDDYSKDEDNNGNVNNKPISVSSTYANEKGSSNEIDDVDQDINFKDKTKWMDKVVGNDNNGDQDGENTNFEDDKDGKDKNVVREVRLHSHRVHMSPPSIP